MPIINLEFRNKGINTTIASLSKVTKELEKTASVSEKNEKALLDEAAARKQLYASTEEILNKTRKSLDSIAKSRGLSSPLNQLFEFRDGEFNIEQAENRLYELRFILADLESVEPLNVLDEEKLKENIKEVKSLIQELKNIGVQELKVEDPNSLDFEFLPPTNEQIKRDIKSNQKKTLALFKQEFSRTQKELQDEFKKTEIEIEVDFKSDRREELLKEQEDRLKAERDFQESLLDFKEEREIQLLELKKQKELEIETLKRQFDDEQNTQSNQFSETQRDSKALFQADIAEEKRQVDDLFDYRIGKVKQEIRLRIAEQKELQDTNSNAEKRQIREKFKEERKQAEDIAKFTEKLEVKKLKPLLEERQKELDAIAQKEREFEAAQREEKRLFNQEQRDKELEFETSVLTPLKEEFQLKIRELKKETESIIIEQKQEFEDKQRQLKIENEENLIALKLEYEEAERSRKKSFQKRQQEDKASFEEKIRKLNLDNAKEIKRLTEAVNAFDGADIRGFDSNGIPRFRDGGKFRPGLAIVGEAGAELVRFNQSGYVYNNDETKEMLNSLNLNPASNGRNGNQDINNLTREIQTLLRVIENKKNITNNNTFINQYQDEKNAYNSFLRKSRSDLVSIINSI